MIQYAKFTTSLEVSHDMLVTVSNNINRRDDTTTTSGHTLYCCERFTFHYAMEFPLYSVIKNGFTEM